MDLLTETEAAKTLRRSKAALRRWRRERRGPNFVRVERAILYRREDLEGYIQKTQINFLKGILTVGRSKTAAGTGRTIPINSELRGILEEYRAWYETKIGPASPEFYAFPSCENRKWDGSRAIGSFKTAWKTVRARAGVKARYHDLRHTAITNLCESGASEETIMAIAGHVSRDILSRYAHIRTEAKRRALEAISNHGVEVPAAKKAAS